MTSQDQQPASTPAENLQLGDELPENQTSDTSKLLPQAKANEEPPSNVPIANKAEEVSNLYVAFLIIGGIVTSVCIVLVNKHIMANFGFNMILTLTALHFFLPWLVIWLGIQAGVKYFETFQAPSFTLRQKLLYVIFQSGSVGWNNASLQVNSVGVYQISKLLCIPCLVAMQAAIFREFVTSKIKAILVVIMLGVGIATVTDMSTSMLGVTLAALAIVFTSSAQIFGGRLQTEHKLTAMQVMYNTLLPQTLTMLVAAFPTEIINCPPDILEKLWSPSLLFNLVISCLMATGVTFFSLSIAGKTSPITLQVVGHLKTCLILLFGFILFDSSMALSQIAKNLAGILTALAGVIAYGEVKRVEKYDKKQPQDAFDQALVACAAATSGTNTNTSEV